MSSIIDFDTAFQSLLTDYAEQTKDTPRGDPRGMTNPDAKIRELVKLSKKAFRLVDQYLKTHSEVETRQYLCTFSNDKKCMPEALRNMLVLHPVTNSNDDSDAAFRRLLSEYKKLTKGKQRGDPRGMTNNDAEVKALKILAKKASDLVDQYLETHSKEEARQYLHTFSHDKKSVPASLSSMLVLHPVWVEKQSTNSLAGV